MVDRFIRDGGWCSCEKSCNSVTGKLESGLSVYPCKHQDPHWIPEGPAWQKNGRARVNAPGARWFLVEGTPTGALGGDREPLIANVTAISELESTSDGFVVLGPAKATEKPHEKNSDGSCKCQGLLDIYNSSNIDDEDGDCDDCSS